MAERLLPEQFREFERFVEKWVLPKGTQRMERRLSSRMEDIQEFYDAMTGRKDEMIRFLDQHPLDEESMPSDHRRLLHLLLALATVAPAVEFFGQPDVVDGFPAERILLQSGAHD